jgi:hypothetical protein
VHHRTIVTPAGPNNHAIAVMYHTKFFPSPRDYLLGRGNIARNIRPVSPSPSRSTNASSTNTRTTTITTTVVSRQTSTTTPVSQRGIIILSRKKSARPEADVRSRAFCRGCRRRRKVSHVLILRMTLLVLLGQKPRQIFSRKEKMSRVMYLTNASMRVVNLCQRKHTDDVISR